MDNEEKRFHLGSLWRGWLTCYTCSSPFQHYFSPQLSYFGPRFPIYGLEDQHRSLNWIPVSHRCTNTILQTQEDVLLITYYIYSFQWYQIIIWWKICNHQREVKLRTSQELWHLNITAFWFFIRVESYFTVYNFWLRREFIFYEMHEGEKGRVLRKWKL